MSTLFKNGYILLPSLNAVRGEVSIENGIISYVGEKAPDIDYGETFDLHENLLMPGFCNAHTHSAMTFIRNGADDLPLDRWLKERIFPVEAKLTPDDVYIFTKLAVLEYLSGGTTSCFDMYFYNEAFVSAVTDCGFRAVLCGAVNDFSQSAEIIEDSFIKYNKVSPLVSYKLGFHAEYTCSEPLLRDIAALSEKYHAPVYCHLSETKQETEECIARHGMTPAEYLESLGMYNNGGGGFHCVYMTDNDIEIFRRHGLYAVTNPCSNAKLGSGIAPLVKLLNAGVPVAVGTDGAASNNSLDMFREVYLGTVLQKAVLCDPAVMPAGEMLKAALSGGAAAMGINCGRIEKGCAADLVVIDLDQPNMQPAANIPESLVYSASSRNVMLTMIGGRVLYKNGEYFIGEAPEEIFRKTAAAKKKLFEKI